jgi:outer membrane lipoprotein carrier protein
MSFFRDKTMMRKRCGSALVVLSLLCATVAQTADDPAKEMLEKVRDRYESITDGEIRFTQHVKFAMARIEQEVSGTLLLKKENKYRVEYEGQTIVTDGQTVWSYSRSTNQVLVDHFRINERSLTPERILGDAPEEYAPALVGHEKIGKIEMAVLKLTPPEGKGMVKSMKLWVQEGDWLIRRVELLDFHGKQTTYQVHSIKTNTGVPDSRFTYQVPDSVEVVDLR